MSFENAFGDVDVGRTSKVEEDNEIQDKVFVRDDSENKLFPEIQIKDLSTITDSNTQLVLDGDGVVWKSCSSVESLYIVCKHKEEAFEVELDGITKFKGAGKNISVDSWLGVENVKREAKGLPLFTAEDFEVTQCSRLNYPTEEKAFEQVQIIIRTKLKSLRQQFGIDKIKFCIGEGKSFRDDLDLVKPYKGTRSPLRPILLKRARQWVLDVLGGELAPEGYENDDWVEWYANESWKVYKKTGVAPYILCCEDKDAFSNPKILTSFGVHSGKDNPNRGKFKYPQAWVVEDTSTSVGGLDLIVTSKKELRGHGLKWLISQAFLIGDSADSYFALKHLKDYKTNYGDVQAYKDFSELKTPKEVLQKAVDLYSEFFPYGIQYTSHKGEDLDVDTMTYMNTYFLVAYMTRSANDKMDFYKLCKAFKVDTSAIVNNNEWTPPYEVFNTEGAEELTKKVVTSLDDTLLEDFKAYKSLKKDDVVGKHSSAEDKIKLIKEGLLDNMYITVQRNKKTGEIRTVTKETTNDE